MENLKNTTGIKITQFFLKTWNPISSSWLAIPVYQSNALYELIFIATRAEVREKMTGKK